MEFETSTLPGAAIDANPGRDRDRKCHRRNPNRKQLEGRQNSTLDKMLTPDLPHLDKGNDPDAYGDPPILQHGS